MALEKLWAWAWGLWWVFRKGSHPWSEMVLEMAICKVDRSLGRLCRCPLKTQSR